MNKEKVVGVISLSMIHPYFLSLKTCVLTSDALTVYLLSTTSSPCASFSSLLRFKLTVDVFQLHVVF